MVEFKIEFEDVISVVTDGETTETLDLEEACRVLNNKEEELKTLDLQFDVSQEQVNNWIKKYGRQKSVLTGYIEEKDEDIAKYHKKCNYLTEVLKDIRNRVHSSTPEAIEERINNFLRNQS